MPKYVGGPFMGGQYGPNDTVETFFLFCRLNGNSELALF